METIDEYIKWERTPRPLGPNSVAKGLLSCLWKLDELQISGENATVDNEETQEELQLKEQGSDKLQKLKGSLSLDQYMPSLEKLQISERFQSSFASSEPLKQPSNLAESSVNRSTECISKDA